VSLRGRSHLTIAARPSSLARWQAGYVGRAIESHFTEIEFEIKVIRTQGDRTLDRALPEIGGKGLFTQELEHALRAGEVDLAVHSLKDLPIDDPEGIRLGAILGREDVRDVLVAKRGKRFSQLRAEAKVGTSSPRRKGQLLAMRPDLQVESIRGNVETRVRKVHEGDYDAAVLAAAGLKRLEMEASIDDWFSLDQILPAPGQGALAVQCRAEDDEVHELLSVIESHSVRRTVMAERAFLASLGGGCSLPVGAYAEQSGDEIHLRGVLARVDGDKLTRGERRGTDPMHLGRRLAEDLLDLVGEERWILDR
jgi:hydroxymethylbilane synthase